MSQFFSDETQLKWRIAIPPPTIHLQEGEYMLKISPLFPVLIPVLLYFSDLMLEIVFNGRLGQLCNL